MPKYRLDHAQEIHIHTFLWAQNCGTVTAAVLPLKGVYKWHFNLGVDCRGGFPPPPQEEKQSEANNE